MIKLLKVISSILFSLFLLFACAIFWNKCVRSKGLTPKKVSNVVEEYRKQIEEIEKNKLDTTIQISKSHSMIKTSVGTIKQFKSAGINIDKKIISKTDFKEEGNFDLIGEESHFDAYGNPESKLKEFNLGSDNCISGYAVLDSNNLLVHLNQTVHVFGEIRWRFIHSKSNLFHFRIKKFFSEKTYIQDIKTDCPNIKIDSINSIQIIKE